MLPSTPAIPSSSMVMVDGESLATGNVIARWEGAVFFFYYVAYTTYIVLEATSHDLRHTLSSVMLMFVIPLTVITLAVVWWRSAILPTDKSLV